MPRRDSIASNNSGGGIPYDPDDVKLNPTRYTLSRGTRAGPGRGSAALGGLKHNLDTLGVAHLNPMPPAPS